MGDTVTGTVIRLLLVTGEGRSVVVVTGRIVVRRVVGLTVVVRTVVRLVTGGKVVVLMVGRLVLPVNFAQNFSPKYFFEDQNLLTFFFHGFSG